MTIDRSAKIQKGSSRPITVCVALLVGLHLGACLRSEHAIIATGDQVALGGDYHCTMLYTSVSILQQRKGASDYFYTFRPKDTPPLTLRFKKLYDQKYLVQVQSNKLDAVRYLYFNIPGRDTAMILYAPQGSSEILAIAGKHNIKVEVSEKEHDWPKVAGTHADTEKLLRAIAHEIDFNDETNTCRRT